MKAEIFTSQLCFQENNIPPLKKYIKTEGKKIHMAMKKVEIITTAIVILSLTVFFILAAAKLISNYLGTSIFNTVVYFAVCYLLTNQISTTKWRILMVALSMGLIIMIFANHFYISPWRWKFVSHLIFGIDLVAMQPFLLMKFSHDQRSIILFTAFVTDVVLLFINRQDLEQFNKIFTVIVSIIVYVILSAFHVKQISDRRWVVAVCASIFAAVLGISFLLRFNWNNKEMLFVLIASINACLSLVPWLWLMSAPKIKAWWQAYIEKETIQDEQYDFLEMAGLPARFTIRELETATANFQAPIGEGASGAVFKGTLADGSTIAVKRIKWKPSGEMEFRTEMTIIASRQHVNLVRLLGFCLSPRGDYYLIYPFQENGSLDTWLFTDDGKKSHLTWTLRYRIAIDVAKALAYLHHECHQRILHLDVKPPNILLDGEFRALLSDFGISKLIGKDESSVMTRARGTVGYLPPEMLMPNAISTKSDVYSYGMVILELVGGRRNLMIVVDGETQQRRATYFPKIVQEKMTQGELMEVVDKTLIKNEGIREEVTVITRLALWCIQENPMLRPNMTEVVEILEGRTPVHVPPKTSMFVVNFMDVESQFGSFARDQVDEAALMSANSLSISIQSGR